MKKNLVNGLTKAVDRGSSSQNLRGYRLMKHTAHKFSYFSVSKILVSTGYPRDSVRKTTEIIDLKDEFLTCKDLEKYPSKISGAIGSNMGSFPVVCGGFDGSSKMDQCQRLVEGEWQQFATMNSGIANVPG